MSSIYYDLSFWQGVVFGVLLVLLVLWWRSIQRRARRKNASTDVRTSSP